MDGKSLVGITQERAADIMMHTGQVVELEVAMQVRHSVSWGLLIYCAISFMFALVPDMICQIWSLER